MLDYYRQMLMYKLAVGKVVEAWKHPGHRLVVYEHYAEYTLCLVPADVLQTRRSFYTNCCLADACKNCKSCHSSVVKKRNMPEANALSLLFDYRKCFCSICAALATNLWSRWLSKYLYSIKEQKLATKKISLYNLSYLPRVFLMLV